MNKHDKRLKRQLAIRDVIQEELRFKKRNIRKQNRIEASQKQTWKIEGTSLTIDNLEEVRDGTVFRSTV
jgi:hypothetical protein